MADSIIISSALSLDEPRFPKIGGGGVLVPGAAIVEFDMGPKLHPAQSSAFTACVEGVSGRAMPYSAPTVAAATFSGGMWRLPANSQATPGFLAGVYTDPGIDLSESDDTEFLLMAWVKHYEAASNFERQFFFIGNDGATIASSACHVSLRYAAYAGGVGNSWRFSFGGASFFGIISELALDTVYCVGFRVKVADGLTRVESYIATNDDPPVLAGTVTAPFLGLAALSGGGCSVGCHGSANGASTIVPNGQAIGALRFQAIPPEVSATRELYRFWRDNAGRFS